MKSIVKSGILAAALVVASAGTARAQWAWEGCGGGKFLTCASVTITTSGNTIIMTVDNYGTYNPATNSVQANSDASTFATIGLNNVGAGVTLTSLQSFTCASAGGSITDPNCSWGFGGTTALSGLPNSPFAGAAASAPAPQNGLNPGAGGTFYRVVLTFTTSGAPNIDNAIFAVHGIAGSTGCSTKFQVAKSGSTYTVSGPTGEPIDPACVTETGDPGTSVPEPATMGLLALGLVGMGGAGLIRRRRNH